MKKALALALALCLLLACLPMSASAATVVLSSQNLTVDGKSVACEKYNIDGSNYFKLRDLACLLSGTPAQFAVSYDAAANAVVIAPGFAYETVGGELAPGADNSASAVPSAQTVWFLDAPVDDLSVYNIGGSNFFKLRDLGKLIGFQVDYDAATNTAVVLSGGPVQAAPAVLSSAEIYAKCAPAVFCITTLDVDGDLLGLGSGFFIDSRGIAVTNHHVMHNAASATVTLTDGRSFPVSGVLYFDDLVDYAVIRVEGSGFPTLTPGDSAAVAGGEKVYAIGSPEGLQNSISDGIVANPRRTDYYDYIQITAPISHGSSGGALINERGEAIGITTSSIDAGQNLNFAVPINAVLEGEDPGSYLASPDLILDMAGFADLDARVSYLHAPDAFDTAYSVEEVAYDLPNGATVYGTVTGETPDYFLLYCNAAGVVDVTLVSPASDPRLLRDIVLELDIARDDLVFEPVWGDLRTETDETGSLDYLHLSYNVTPGVYVLYIYSDALYQTEKLNTDYVFYYLYEPGAKGENSTGAGYDGAAARPAQPTPAPAADSARQAAAYDAVRAWVQKNANSAIAGNRSYAWTVDDGDGSYALELADVEMEGEHSLLLVCTYYYSDGDVDEGWLFLEREGQDCFFSYDYYFAGNDGEDTDFTGDVSLSAPAFNAGRPVLFDETSGPVVGSDMEAMMPYFAAYTLADMLLILDDLLPDAAAGYTVADFGFDPAKLSTDSLFPA